jgi:hypothetical protein
VLDLATGRMLAANHLADAARTLAASGSTLKPLALYGLIAAGLLDPGRRIACLRNLHIALRPLGRRLRLESCAGCWRRPGRLRSGIPASIAARLE